MSKGTVLQKACEYVAELTEDNKILEKRVQDLEGVSEENDRLLSTIEELRQETLHTVFLETPYTAKHFGQAKKLAGIFLACWSPLTKRTNFTSKQAPLFPYVRHLAVYNMSRVGNEVKEQISLPRKPAHC